MRPPEIRMLSATGRVLMGLREGVVLLVALLVCLGLAGVLVRDQHALNAHHAQFQYLRQAHHEAMSGLLRLLLTPSSSPDDAQTVVPLLTTLRQRADGLGRDGDDLVRVTDRAQAELARLVDLDAGTRGAVLRRLLLELDAQALATDAQLTAMLDRKIRDQQQGLMSAMLLGTGLLLLVGLGRAWAERARRRAEAALRDRESQFRAMVQALNEGVVIVDEQGRVLRTNAAAQLALGETVALGAVLDDQLATLQLSTDTARRLIQEARQSGHRLHDELLALRGGEPGPTWLQCSVEPIEGDLDVPEGAVMSFSDITEQRRAADELDRYRSHLESLVAQRTQDLERAVAAQQAAHRFLRTVTDHIPGRVVYWHRDLRCGFINQAHAEWLGRHPEEVLNQSMLDIIGQAQFEQRQPQVQAALRGQRLSFERVDERPDGRQVVSLVHYIPDEQDGEVIGFHVLATDITALKASEAALRELNDALAEARDRAEAASRAKGAFLANMSHEIRTPMAAIVGLNYLLLRETTDPAHRERLNKMHDAAQHLQRVINDVLDLSKIEAGKLTLHPLDFSLDSLLAGTCELLRERASDKGIELVVDTDHVPGALRGDPTRLSQALLNYLSNAVKFTDHGSIVLRTRIVPQEGADLLLLFEVQDTGIGIPPERMGSLFNAFEQVDNSFSRRHSGTGLGLAITKHIAELMGGQAGAQSTLGQGSRFWFTARFERVLDAQANTRSGLHAGLRVLLVDDLPEAREAVGEMLRGLGLQVDAVSDSEAAVARCREALTRGAAHEVLLIDWMMPGRDGLATLQAIHDLPGLAQVPALLVSAHDESDLRQRALKAGFTDLLLKPLTPSQLNDGLMRALRLDPAPSTRSRPTSAQEQEVLQHAGARILLVEDNPINQEVALDLLQAVGMQVDVAGNGRVAIDRAEGNDYDLILMDVQMPEVDGLAATRALRRTVRHQRTPILAMTANAFGEDRSACLEAGMDDHVAKPVDPPALYSMLLRWLPMARQLRGVPAGSQPSAEAPTTLPRRAGETLPPIAGLDVARAVQLCGGDVATCRRVLRQFVQLYGPGGSGSFWSESRLEIDPVELARQAHSLRGASASIGADAVRMQAERLEQSAKAAADPALLQAGLRALRVALADLVQAIDAGISASAP